MATTTPSTDILIIGAGTAGLMAAYSLLQSGRKVTVLEAQSSPGGRIRTIQKANDAFPAELGAEFVHGDLPVTGGLVQKAGLEYLEMSGGFFRVEDGVWNEMEEVIEGWDELLQRMAAVEEDMTMRAFLDRFYNAPEHKRLRKEAEAFTRNFDVADPDKVSIKGLVREWSKEEGHNKKLREGYGKLVEYLAAACREMGASIHMDAVVKQVHWEEGNVRAITADQRTYTASKTLIAVPLGVLTSSGQAASIAFMPDIASYREAAAGIGYGNVVKLLLFFRQAFWKEKQADAGFVISNELIPTWWTGPPERLMLTGWLGGPGADALSGKNNTEILQTALDSLSRIFQKSPEQLRDLLDDWLVVNWRKEPYALGAYSYPALPTEKAIRQLQTPIRDTLYFAGEAIYDGAHPGTVEAALESGKKAAERIVQR